MQRRTNDKKSAVLYAYTYTIPRNNRRTHIKVGANL